MRTLMNELKEVDRWISLGLNLMIPDYELQRIQATCHFDYSQIMIEILRAWLKAGNASWITLVSALRQSGFASLANRIANEHGEFDFRLCIVHTAHCIMILAHIYCILHSNLPFLSYFIGVPCVSPKQSLSPLRKTQV